MNDAIHVLREHATAIFKAGVAAADPFQAVKDCLNAGEHHLEIAMDRENPDSIRSGRWSRVHILAFGKAACAMADAAQQSIPAHMQAAPGLAVTNYENERQVDHIQVLTASHPLPDQAGLEAAKLIAERARLAQQDELVLVLVSGGGSALLPYPVDGVSLQDKIATTDLLLASGATINQVNCVRKHLSQLKGGNLARLASPADLHALILSDVLGDDLSAIASGPTVADDSCYVDAITILHDRNTWDKIPETVRRHLDKGRLGEIAETPKSGDPLFKHTCHTLIGGNRISVDAMLQAAKALDYDTLLYSDNLCGEARDEAEKLAQYVQGLQQRGFNKATAILAGGETTVTLKGDGKGGRNQEMALAFALAAQKQTLQGDWVFLSGGTDGRDGPTDAAGGITDPYSLERIGDAAEWLDNNDSYHALKQSQDLLDTGATGTNVADLQVLLIQPTR